MSLRDPLINISKYATQFAQLHRYGSQRDQFGDVRTVVATVQTIPCYLYLDEERQEQTNPVITDKVRQSMVIPSSVTSVQQHDHVVNVTDQFGNVVLDEARIARIIRYPHWKFAPRFFKVELNTDLNG